jgi:uncharacterized membrane protein
MMSKGRLEAFSDGVIAIIITIMVLEMKVATRRWCKRFAAASSDLSQLRPKFRLRGHYWNNHHHMLQACTVATGAMLWANLHLLFWLSLFPFATGWMGQNHFTAVPTALYGVVLLMAALAYNLLQQVIIRGQGYDSILKKAVGRDWERQAEPAVVCLGNHYGLTSRVGRSSYLRRCGVDLADPR